jgi:hypothetical protein
MAATHAQSGPQDVTGSTGKVGDAGLEQVPGVEAATLLFDRGLWFEAVVRGLRSELEFTEEQAKQAATTAAALRGR